MHFPLERAALCANCQAVFEIGAEACPACGSEQWTSLARFLDGTRFGRGRCTGDLASVSSRPVAAPPEDSGPLHHRDGSASTNEGSHPIQVYLDKIEEVETELASASRVVEATRFLRPYLEEVEASGFAWDPGEKELLDALRAYDAGSLKDPGTPA